MKLAVLMVLVLSGIRTLADESTDRLDDFSDISLDDNEHTSSADLSHLSDDEFLSGGGAGGAGGAVGRPGELPGSVAARDKGALMLRLVGGALKKPGMDQRFGQILPILRVMSPPQRLALTALVMQQAMVPKDDPEPALEMAVKLGATPDGSSNLTSQLLLPLSADIAHIFRGAGLEPGPAAQGRSNQLYRTQAPYHPQLQMPRWRGPQRGSAPGPAPAMPPPLHGPRLPAPDGPQRRYTDTDRLPPPGVNRRNAHVSPRLDMIPPPLPGLAKPTTLRPVDSGDLQGCSLFSDTVCASVEHYPEEAILASIHADKHTVNALLADKVPPAAAEVARTNAMQRRQDDDYPSGHEDQQALVDNQDVGEDGQLCAAIIKFARPQRARATSGQWKYIVNTAEHTQTLRLEKCMRVEESCSFLSDKVRSHCSQVYNYHRLLTWDKELGLHMDIFKVPTCCSCRIQKSPFLPSNSVARRPGVGGGGGGGGGPQFTPHQPYPPLQQAEYSNNQETVVFSESGRPVHPQYRPYGQVHDSSVGDVTSRDPVSRTSSKPTWPFRKAATRRPPLQATHQKQYGLQTLEENGAPGELLPPYPPLPLENEYDYPPLAGRRTGSARNRTREQVPDDLTAEGSQRHPIPVILSPEGEVIRDGVRDKTRDGVHDKVRDGVRDSGRPSTSKRPLIVSLPPRLETYRPRTTTPASTTTPLPPLVLPTTTATPGGTPAPKRVNYNYHPIIDFFRPLEKQMSAQEPRSGRRPPPPEQVAEQRAVPDSAGPSWSAQQSDWSPITSSVSP